MGKYRMEEPWGYQEERDYKSNIQEEVSIAGLFDKVEYNKGDNKMYFYDTYGKKCGTVDVSEFEEEAIVVKAYYDKETQEIVIEFVNGDVVRINVKEVLDENEFKDGLQVNDGIVSILVDSNGEGYEGNPYLSTSEDGLKISGIDKHIDDAVEAERVRAVAEEERIDAKLDAEITRATTEEARIDAKLDQEIADRIADVDEEEARAKAEELAANRRIDRLNDELDAEKTIREAADAALGRRIDQEIDDRISDVDAEEERAIAAEEALQTAIDNEAARATSAETALDEKIVAETERAISAETELSASIEEEAERATNAEAELDAKIDESVSSLTEAIESEISNRKAQAIHSAEYVKADNKIYFKNANDEAISEVDTTDFVVDGMVDDVKIENGNLVITFNTDAGKQDISIPLTEIFDPSNYYTKDDVDGKVVTINENIADEVSARESGDTALDDKIAALEDIAATKAALEAEVARATAEEAKKVEKTIQGSNGKALIFNESDGGGAKFEHNDGTWSFAGVNDGGENGIAGQVYALKKNAENKMEGTRIDITKDAMYYTVGSDSAANRMVAANEIAVKGDIPTDFYTQSEVDEMVNAKADADAVYTKGEVDAIAAEKADISAIPSVVDFFDGAEYDSSAKTINFYNGSTLKAHIDATEFVVDGMVEDVKIENGNLVITFNTDSGKEAIEIPLTEIFDPSNYYTKDEVNAEITSATTDMATQTWVNEGLALKADKETTYTQEEVDALLLAKENEIYNLTKIVGDMGGAVTYEYPNEAGKSLTTLLNNNGTVKLGEDATITRFGPGVTAKNNVKLNLNNHNLTSTAASSYGAIMARGTQQITIGGKGTIDAGDGICIEANGTSTLEPLATFNLTGSTTVYRNNRPGGELVYCYVGIVNITNGTFRNDGGSEYMLNCYDANYAAGKANIIVTGGKFYDFNPADNKAEGEHTSFVPEGYHVETSTVTEEGVEHTIYTVKKD